MQTKIMPCVLSALEVVNSTLAVPLPVERGRECPLYGEGAMDSISLVLFISLVEQNIEDQLHQPIILADEKAMSAKNSPFLTVGRLSDYIEKLLEVGA